MSKDSLADLSNLATNFWIACDKNKDNRLNKDEIDEAMLDSSIQGKQAAALATMKFAFEWLSSLCVDDHSTKDAITRQDLEALSASRSTAGFSSTEVFFQDAQRELEHYQHTKYRIEGPSKDDPVQGPLGDCQLVSTLSAFADKRSAKILGSISEDKEHNSYTVNFSLGDDTWQTEVPKPTESKLAYYRSSVDWPLVYQSAYGRFLADMCQNKDLRSDFLSLHGLPKDFQPSILSEDNLRGGGFPLATMMIVGGDIKVQHIVLKAPLSKAEEGKLANALESGLVDSYPAVATTNGDPSLHKLGLIPSHAYSIVKYLPEKHALLMRNPHTRASNLQVNSHDTGSIEIEVPLETVSQAFDGIDIFYDQPTDKIDQAIKAITPIKKQSKRTNLYLLSCDKDKR